MRIWRKIKAIYYIITSRNFILTYKIKERHYGSGFVIITKVLRHTHLTKDGDILAMQKTIEKIKKNV